MVAMSAFGSFSAMKVSCKDMDVEKMVTLAAELFFGEQAVKDAQCSISLNTLISLLPKTKVQNLRSPFHLHKHFGSLMKKFGKGKKEEEGDEDDEFYLRQAAPAEESPVIRIITLVRAIANTYKVCKSVSQ